MEVGDIVEIVERKGEARDYPCSFMREMTCYKGKQYVILRKNKLDENYISRVKERKYYNHDDYSYIIGELSTRMCMPFIWHSSMLKLVNNKEAFLNSIF
jgi:hypothetical protein